jgi:hypothetical protein
VVVVVLVALVEPVTPDELPIEPLPVLDEPGPPIVELEPPELPPLDGDVLLLPMALLPPGLVLPVLLGEVEELDEVGGVPD